MESILKNNTKSPMSAENLLNNFSIPSEQLVISHNMSQRRKITKIQSKLFETKYKLYETINDHIKKDKEIDPIIEKLCINIKLLYNNCKLSKRQLLDEINIIIKTLTQMSNNSLENLIESITLLHSHKELSTSTNVKMINFLKDINNIFPELSLNIDNQINKINSQFLINSVSTKMQLIKFINTIFDNICENLQTNNINTNLKVKILRMKINEYII